MRAARNRLRENEREGGGIAKIRETGEREKKREGEKE